MSEIINNENKKATVTEIKTLRNKKKTRGLLISHLLISQEMLF